jgi:hypothetical protein
MDKLVLRLRDLRTGDGSTETFGDEAAAVAWLRDRPRFIEVRGVATLDVPSEVNARLRAALRPLDPEEIEKEKELDAQLDAAARARNEEQQQKEKAASEAHRAAMATADPHRVMEVHFRYDKPLELTDAADKREITPEAREAVMAWVRERDEWVKDRGQVVGDAKVSVLPGPVPSGAERVKGGSFIPVTAPAAKPN